MHQNHTTFIKLLKEKFNAKQLILTLTLQSYKDDFFKVFDYPGIVKYADFIHFQLARINNARLKDELQTRNIQHLQDVIANLLKFGVPSTKILMGINFEGFEIRYPYGFSKHDSNPYASFREGSDYICFNLLHRKYNFTYESEVGVRQYNYTYNSGIGAGNLLLESSRVIANKIRFAIRKNLAGVHITDLDCDDHYNRCAELDNDTYDDFKSLITGVTLNIPKRIHGYAFFANIVNEATMVALDEIDQETKIIAKEFYFIQSKLNDHFENSFGGKIESTTASPATVTPSLEDLKNSVLTTPTPPVTTPATPPPNKSDIKLRMIIYKNDNESNYFLFICYEEFMLIFNKFIFLLQIKRMLYK